MKGEERRKQLLNILSSSNNPVSGGTLAKELNVSRQIIVQDISLLRANGATIPEFLRFITQMIRLKRN